MYKMMKKEMFRLGRIANNMEKHGCSKESVNKMRVRALDAIRTPHYIKNPGNKNVKVLRSHENVITGVKVELTKKMTVSGHMIVAVVVTNRGHRDIKVFKGTHCLGIGNLLYKHAIA